MSDERTAEAMDERARLVEALDNPGVTAGLHDPIEQVKALVGSHRQLVERVKSVEADNAALVDLLVRAAGVLRDLAGMPMEADFLSDTAAEPHPGAALLERVRRLEEALREIHTTPREAMSLDQQMDRDRRVQRLLGLGGS